MKLKKEQQPLPPLEKGQLWKTETSQVEIMSVGKTLAHYRFFQNQKRTPTTLSPIQMVQDYLKEHSAILVRNERLMRARA